MNYLLLFIIILCIIIFNNSQFLGELLLEKYQNNDMNKKAPTSDNCHQSLDLKYGAYNECENWWNCFKKNGYTSSRWCDGNPSQCTKYKDIIKNADIDFNKNYSKKDSNVNLDSDLSENKVLDNLSDLPESIEDNISWQDFQDMIIDTDNNLNKKKKNTKIENTENVIENKLPNVDYLAEEERWKKFNQKFNKSKQYESKYLELSCNNDLLICPNSAEILNEF